MITNSPPTIRANYAYSQYSVVDEMARRYRASYNPNAIAGMPRDTFRQSTVLTSARYYTPPSEGKVFAKQFGSFIRDMGTILGLVGMFVPPVAAVATVAKPIASMVGTATDQIDIRPTAVQTRAVGNYNYWFR